MNDKIICSLIIGESNNIDKIKDDIILTLLELISIYSKPSICLLIDIAEI